MDVVNLSISEQMLHRIWPRSKMDVVNLSISGQMHHRIWPRAIVCARQAFFIPSNSVETENGCRACARQAMNTPSDSAEAVIGCIVCARQAFCTPSELAEIENGCRASARPARKVPGRPEKCPAGQKSIRLAREAPHLHPCNQQIHPSTPHAML